MSQFVEHVYAGVSASIQNKSRVTIKSTRAALTETITYLARGKVIQSKKRELAALTKGKIRPGERDEWSNEQLYVPPLPPTNLRGCHLIKIHYDVYVSMFYVTICNTIMTLDQINHVLFQYEQKCIYFGK